MTDNWLSIVWASRANWDREENDFYPTPASAVRPLIEIEWLIGIPVWWYRNRKWERIIVKIKQEHFKL